MVFGGMPLRAGGLVHATLRVFGHIDDVNVGMEILALASKLRARNSGMTTSLRRRSIALECWRGSSRACGESAGAGLLGFGSVTPKM
jgi:hypothetical protein